MDQADAIAETFINQESSVGGGLGELVVAEVSAESLGNIDDDTQNQATEQVRYIDERIVDEAQGSKDFNVNDLSPQNFDVKMMPQDVDVAEDLVQQDGTIAVDNTTKN